MKRTFNRLYLIPVSLLLGPVSISHFTAPPSYDYLRHNISQLACQNYEWSWITQTAFLLFGISLSLILLPAAVRLIRSSRRGDYRTIQIACSFLALCGYGLAISLSGIWLDAPFIPETDFDTSEASIHSILASAAGFLFCAGIFFQIFAAATWRRKMVHIIFLSAVMILSALTGFVEPLTGLFQRLLWIVGLSWMLFFSVSPGTDSKCVGK